MRLFSPRMLWLLATGLLTIAAVNRSPMLQRLVKPMG